jgi:hypothetical protein
MLDRSESCSEDRLHGQCDSLYVGDTCVTMFEGGNGGLMRYILVLNVGHGEKARHNEESGNCRSRQP